MPGHVRDYLQALGFRLPEAEMKPHIREWDRWMHAVGDFYDYRDADGAGRTYEVHRRSVMLAMQVYREWWSIPLNERTQVVCDDPSCSAWLERELGPRASGRGRRRRWFAPSAWGRARWPCGWTWGNAECAFVTRVWSRGEPVDQLQLHLLGSSGYRIETACFDPAGRVVEALGVAASVEVGCATSPLGIVRPAVPNTRVERSPYGQSVFANAVNAMQSVDLAFDAMIDEVDAGKMRVFLSDMMFDVREDGKDRSVPIPFGRSDCTVFHKVINTEDTIQEFAPALRTEAQGRALRVALQVLGDLMGLGVDYFDLDKTCYVRTATEVSSDNSGLMRNVRKHENALAPAIANACRALMAGARLLGESLGDEGGVSVSFDNSIVQDTEAEKRQCMSEVAARLMRAWEYRARWYGEDEATARSRAAELSRSGSPVR